MGRLSRSQGARSIGLGKGGAWSGSSPVRQDGRRLVYVLGAGWAALVFCLAPTGFGSRSVRGTLRIGVLGALARLSVSCIIYEVIYAGGSYEPRSMLLFNQCYFAPQAHLSEPVTYVSYHKGIKTVDKRFWTRRTNTSQFGLGQTFTTTLP